MKREFLNDLLKEHVSEEKTLKDILDKVMDENGKDITSVQTKLTTAEADKKAVQEKLDATNATLEKFKDVDVDELKGEIDVLKADLEAKDKDHKAELEKQEYDRAVNDFFGKLPEGYEFASELSKEAAMSKFTAAELKLNDGKFLGAEDFLKGLKEKNPTAFKSTDPIDTKQPVGPTGGGGSGDKDAAMRAVMGLVPRLFSYLHNSSRVTCRASASLIAVDTLPSFRFSKSSIVLTGTSDNLLNAGTLKS